MRNDKRFLKIYIHLCFAQVQKKGREVGKAQKQLQMDLAAIEAVCMCNDSESQQYNISFIEDATNFNSTIWFHVTRLWSKSYHREPKESTNLKI